MTTQPLSTRIAALSDANRTIFHLTNRLAKLQFQPGSTPLDGEEGDVRLELSAEIHDLLKQQEEELELVKLDVEDLNSNIPASNRSRDSERDRERAHLTAQVVRLEEDLRQSRAQFRRAQLLAKRASDAAKAHERTLLLASIRSGPSTSDLHTTTPSQTSRASTPTLFGPRRRPHKPAPTQDDLLVTTAGDITATLRRTHDLLSSELSRSQFAQQTLDESNAALAELSETYSQLDTLLKKGGSLVGTLLRSQKSDTWYLETACVIAAVTIAWLFYRRILLGPLKLLVIWPVKIFYRVSFWLLSSGLGLVGAAGRRVVSGQTQTHSSSFSRSLIVQPSASGGPVRFSNVMSGGAYTMAVGAGGKGAKEGPLQGQGQGQSKSMSEEVGRMAEQSREDQGLSGQHQEVKRGDGTTLRERGTDEPRNPRKRMMEEPPSGERRDEL